MNTDRREAGPLARLMRAGELTPVEVPTVADDAIRALRRAREDPLRDRQAAEWRLNAVGLRHESRSTGRATWGPAHRRWRREGGCPPPAQPIVFQEHIRTVTEHPERLQRLEQARQNPGQARRLAPGVDARQALRRINRRV